MIRSPRGWLAHNGLQHFFADDAELRLGKAESLCGGVFTRKAGGFQLRVPQNESLCQRCERGAAELKSIDRRLP